MEAFYPELIALAQVIVIDVVLAGDNAIVVGLAASRVAPELRARVIFWGIAGAVVLRIAFAGVTMQLLAIVGLTLAGGILLLWVCWKMYREIVRHSPQPASLGAAVVSSDERPRRRSVSGARSPRSSLPTCPCRSTTCWPWPALPRVTRGCWWSGLAVAVVLMAVAATYIARLLARFPWITWVGLAIILYVAVDMMWRGSLEVACTYVPEQVCQQGLVSSIGRLLDG